MPRTQQGAPRGVPVSVRRGNLLRWLRDRPEVWLHTTLIAAFLKQRNHLVRGDLKALHSEGMVERTEDFAGFHWRAV